MFAEKEFIWYLTTCPLQTTRKNPALPMGVGTTTQMGLSRMLEKKKKSTDTIQINKKNSHPAVN